MGNPKRNAMGSATNVPDGFYEYSINDGTTTVYLNVSPDIAGIVTVSQDNFCNEYVWNYDITNWELYRSNDGAPCQYQNGGGGGTTDTTTTTQAGNSSLLWILIAAGVGFGLLIGNSKDKHSRKK